MARAKSLEKTLALRGAPATVSDEVAKVDNGKKQGNERKETGARQIPL